MLVRDPTPVQAKNQTKPKLRNYRERGTQHNRYRVSLICHGSMSHRYVPRVKAQADEPLQPRAGVVPGSACPPPSAEHLLGEGNTFVQGLRGEGWLPSLVFFD